MPGFLGLAHAVMLRTMSFLGAMSLLGRGCRPCLTDKCEEDRRTEETTQQPEVLVHPVLPHRPIGTKHRDPNGQSGRMLSSPWIGPCHVWATGHKNPEARLVPLERAVRPSLGHSVRAGSRAPSFGPRGLPNTRGSNPVGLPCCLTSAAL